MVVSIEIWEDIRCYKGLYQVSNHGRVKSLDRIIVSKLGHRYRIKGVILKPMLHKQGYLTYGLCKFGKCKFVLGHILVLEAFVCLRPNAMEACHNNGDKKDNCLSNLRWDTRENNCKDRLYHGVSRKLTMRQVRSIRRLRAKGYSQQFIGDKFDVSQVMVGKIVRNELWKF